MLQSGVAAVLTDQAVIFCGGRGERLRPLTDSVPKPLAPVAGRPFLAHILEQLRDNGYREAVLLTGYRGEMIRESLGDGAQLGIRLTYRDGPEEWQTARRLWDARRVLKPHFLLLYGDNYATFQHLRLEQAFIAHGRVGCLTVHPRGSSANVTVDAAGRITAYDSNRSIPGLNAVEIGYSLVSSDVFSAMTEENESFSAVLARLGAAQQLSAFVQRDAYQSISDPARLAVADAYFTPKKILLVDRDGTINRKPERARYVSTWGEWQFVPETLVALRRLASVGWSFVVISNQAGVARDIVTEGQVWDLDQRMRAELTREKVNVLESYYCFHHWDDHCSCRKPEPGMFLAAARDFGLRLDRTWYLGDDPRDCSAAWRSGCRCGYIGPPGELESLPPEERPAGVFGTANDFAEMLLSQ